MAKKMHDVVVSRVIGAPLAKVWAFWTDAEKVKLWWGPDHFICPNARLDVRVGSTSLVSMASPEFGFPEQYSTWLYTVVEPMTRIEYIHNLADANGRRVDPTEVGLPADFPQDLKTVVTFEDLGAKTRLTVVETLPETSMLENAKLGLNQSVDKLVAAAEG